MDGESADDGDYRCSLGQLPRQCAMTGRWVASPTGGKPLPMGTHQRKAVQSPVSDPHTFSGFGDRVSTMGEVVPPPSPADHGATWLSITTTITTTTATRRRRGGYSGAEQRSPSRTLRS